MQDYMGFDVKRRNNEHGEWELVKRFPVKTVSGGGWFGMNTESQNKEQGANLRNVKAQAVAYAKELYDGTQDVKVWGTQTLDCTFCVTHWINGKWYDDKSQPVASD